MQDKVLMYFISNVIMIYINKEEKITSGMFFIKVEERRK